MKKIRRSDMWQTSMYSYEHFMKDLFPRESDRHRAEDLIYYLMEDEKRMRKLIVFSGTGSTGKTTFVKFLKEIFGDYLVNGNHPSLSSKIRTQSRALVYDGGVANFDTIRNYVEDDTIPNDINFLGHKYEYPINFNTIVVCEKIPEHLSGLRRHEINFDHVFRGDYTPDVKSLAHHFKWYNGFDASWSTTVMIWGRPRAEAWSDDGAS